jgi:hypothetical protein
MFSNVITCLRNAGALLLSKEFEANAKMGHGKPATLGPSSTSAHGCPTSTNINIYQPINLSGPRRAGRLPRRPSVASMRTEAVRCHRCHVPRYPRYNDKKCLPIGSMVLLYMVTFTINIPPMLAYIAYMDPMG